MVRAVFCHQLAEWPAEAETIEEVPVEACWRSGSAIHLVLQRRQNRRSLFVWTRARGRPVIFWRSAASMHAARPGIRVPSARGLEGPLEIAVDARECYSWRFPGKGATLIRRDLPVGDYAVVRDGLVVAAVERKTVGDLATAAIAGKLGLALAELERLPHAALAVEGRWSDLVKLAQRAGSRPGWLLGVAVALQVAHPRITWTFAETPKVAQDWSYRWLAACAKADRDRHQIPLLEERAIGDPLAVAEPAAGARLLDAAERRALILREAKAGLAWSSRAVAERCGVTQATAAKDLRALVAEVACASAGRDAPGAMSALSSALAPASRQPRGEEASHVGIGRLVEHRVGGPHLTHPTVDHHRDPLGQRARLLAVVRDQKRGHAVVDQDLGEVGDQCLARRRVERREGLVQEQDLGYDREGSREAHALRFASG